MPPFEDVELLEFKISKAKRKIPQLTSLPIKEKALYNLYKKVIIFESVFKIKSMGKRKERRLAALSNTGRRVKLDLFAEPSGYISLNLSSFSI